MMKSPSLSRLFAALLCTLVFTFSLPSETFAQNGPGGERYSFSGIYAFGDSLSDTGNIFALTGFPPQPYFEGRFSNGPVWLEYLANSLRLDSSLIVNYAYGGATTGRENFYDDPGVIEFPGLQDELDFFEADLNGEPADERALYVVWAGPNDFFIFGPSAATIGNGVANTVAAVQRLHLAGARHIMVVNLPDLGLTPFGQNVDPTALSFLSGVYNDTLDTALDALAVSGIPTIRVDSQKVLREMVALPQAYQLSNVTESFLATGGDPDDFLFWDLVHPTTTAHGVIADEAMHVLRRKAFAK